MSNQSLNLTIHSDHSVVEINGIKRTMDTAEAINAITGYLNIGKVESLESFRLPRNTTTFAHGPRTAKLQVYFPQCRRDVTHTGLKDKLNIAVPNIIIVFDLNKSNTQSTWGVGNAVYFCTSREIGAIEERFVSAKDKDIWVLPFPNIFSSGKPCYGGNSMPTGFIENDLRGLLWYYEFLFSSPFNNDLSIPSISTGDSPTKWLNRLAKAEAFPYDLLSR